MHEDERLYWHDDMEAELSRNGAERWFFIPTGLGLRQVCKARLHQGRIKSINRAVAQGGTSRRPGKILLFIPFFMTGYVVREKSRKVVGR